MKKRLMALVVLIVVLTGTSLFGQGLGFSAGAGLVVAPEWGKIELSGGGDSANYVDSFQSPLGIQAFFDATYVQLRVGYLFGGKRNLPVVLNPGDPIDDRFSGTYDFSVLDLNILGKYPFQIGPITLSPAVGVGYTLFTRLNLPKDFDDFGGEPVQDVVDFIRNDQGNAEADNIVVLLQSSNRWWINAGIDAEIPLTSSLFLQPSILAQFGLASSIERSVKDLYLNLGADSYSQSNFRLQTSLSVGYRF